MSWRLIFQAAYLQERDGSASFLVPCMSVKVSKVLNPLGSLQGPGCPCLLLQMQALPASRELKRLMHDAVRVLKDESFLRGRTKQTWV